LFRSGQDKASEWIGDQESANRLTTYVRDKFEANIFSRKEAQALIKSVLAHLKGALTANRNRLHALLTAEWNHRGVDWPDFDVSAVIAEFQQKQPETLEQMGKDSLTHGVLSFLGGYVAESAATRIVFMLASRAVVPAASSALAGSTAMTAGAAAGGSGGSLAGPWGTVICGAAGIVCGMIVDYWTSRHFEKKLIQETRGMVVKMKLKLIHGTRKKAGLKKAMQEAVEHINDMEATAIEKHLGSMVSAKD